MLLSPIMNATFTLNSRGFETELRGRIADGAVTIERRENHVILSQPSAWVPVTIGELRSLMSARNGLGAWVGRAGEEAAVFTQDTPGDGRPARRPTRRYS